MSRTISEIYSEAIVERNKRLELSEYKSDSRLSVMNAIFWVVAAVIYSFESLLDVFALDISDLINNRINGTPTYYANALLKYQKGDTIVVREDGLAFGYNSIDTTKQIITQVSYEESTSDVNIDNKIIMKVATGGVGNLSIISEDDLIGINAYVNQIKFAGTRIEVISQNGDILVPRVTVFYDGAIETSTLYDNIDAALNNYIKNLGFNSGVFISKVIDAIQSVDHVTDVFINPSDVVNQGIFLASYNSDGTLQPESEITRVAKPLSGYLKQSSGINIEKDIPTFRDAIVLKIES